jgi:hypothetical protein
MQTVRSPGQPVRLKPDRSDGPLRPPAPLRERTRHGRRPGPGPLGVGCSLRLQATPSDAYPATHAAATAKQARLGVWGACGGDFHSANGSTTSGARPSGHRGRPVAGTGATPTTRGVPQSERWWSSRASSSPWRRRGAPSRRRRCVAAPSTQAPRGTTPGTRRCLRTVRSWSVSGCRTTGAGSTGSRSPA